MAERAHGIFDTREEAICDARQHFLDMGQSDERPLITVAKVQWADPLRYLDPERILEQVDEAAFDSDFSFWDDPVFDIARGGRTVFKHMLEDWAREYVKPQCWVMCEGEEVQL